jgi:hypothetical protein
MNRILAFVMFALSAMGLAGGALFAPSFVMRHLSSDGSLEAATVSRILNLQIYSLVLGSLGLVVSAALLSFMYRQRLQRSQRFPYAIALCSLILLPTWAIYIDGRYPNHLLWQPSKVGRFILGQDLLLKEYQPKSMLKTVEHKVTRAKFPIINIHEHFTYPLSMGERRPEDMIRVMDAVNVQKIVDLDGDLGAALKEKIQKYQTPYPERFSIFAHVWFSENGTHEHILSGKITDDIVEAAKMGARGIKIWKNLGLTSRDASGKLIPLNDPRLDPLWNKAGELKLPILIHILDPPANFMPLDRFNEDYEWFSSRPSYNFSGPDFPSANVVYSQFENVLAKHPNTIFIGAHLLSIGDDLGYLSSVLDKHPNLFVDTAFMTHRLGRQPYSARTFCLKYQDRILFGTDAHPTQEDYGAHFRFYETADEYFDPPFFSWMPDLPRWKIYGIFLPDDVLKKIYYQNAEKLFARTAH